MSVITHPCFRTDAECYLFNRRTFPAQPLVDPRSLEEMLATTVLDEPTAYKVSTGADTLATCFRLTLALIYVEWHELNEAQDGIPMCAESRERFDAEMAEMCSWNYHHDEDGNLAMLAGFLHPQYYPDDVHAFGNHWTI